MIVSPRVLRIRTYAVVQCAIANKKIRAAKNYDCLDCGEPAVGFDHRDYAHPLKVDPVCASCNNKRGEGLPAINGPDIEVSWITDVSKIMATRRFEVWLTKQYRQALEKLAEHDGVTMSKWVKNAIRCAAKRKKVWQ